MSSIFQPKSCDLFYSDFYILINREVIESKRLREKFNYIYCKRCLKFLGESNAGVVKIWSENVSFGDNHVSFYTKSSIHSVIELIRRNLNTLKTDNSNIYLSSIVKIIFEAINPKNNHKLYLLIQILDQNLDLFKLNLENFELEPSKGIKVMFFTFTIHPDKDNDENLKTLNFWLKDINTTQCEISSDLYYTFCRYLDTNSKYIPDFYRKNNLFNLTYIDL